MFQLLLLSNKIITRLHVGKTLDANVYSTQVSPLLSGLLNCFHEYILWHNTVSINSTETRCGKQQYSNTELSVISSHLSTTQLQDDVNNPISPLFSLFRTLFNRRYSVE